MKYTIMSYNLNPDGGGAYPTGLQQLDIAALQDLYGVNYATRADDTKYRFYSSDKQVTTIWDGGGTDTFSAGTFDKSVVIDLQPGHFSSIGGKENIATALISHLPQLDQFRALIENAIGGSGDDDLIGNKAKNYLKGNKGTNKLYGMEGDDVLISQGFLDVLDGGTGNDALFNAENDGNTTYVFSRGGGHDGILDYPLGQNIEIFLKDLDPGAIKLFAKRYDENNLDTPGPDYRYSAVHLEVIETGDTLVLPWVYRNSKNSTNQYISDRIEFSNGQIWDMQDFESYISLTDVTSKAELVAQDPVIYAWKNMANIANAVVLW